MCVRLLHALQATSTRLVLAAPPLCSLLAWGPVRKDVDIDVVLVFVNDDYVAGTVMPSIMHTA